MIKKGSLVLFICLFLSGLFLCINTVPVLHHVNAEDDPYLNLLVNGTCTSSGIRVISEAMLDENRVVYHVRVDYEGLAPREAEIRVYPIPGSNGTVFLLSGGTGGWWYGDGNEQIVDALRDEGYETVEFRWIEDWGWAANNPGQGFVNLSSGTAELMKWVVSDVAENPDVVGATGHSGGANEIAYGMSTHGLDEFLDVAVLTGGPARADLVALSDVNATGVCRIIDYVMGWFDNGDYCVSGDKPEWVVEALHAESIVPKNGEKARDFDYPHTRVVFVEGALDQFKNSSTSYFDVITCEKTWMELEGVGHGVTIQGADVIIETLSEGLNACRIALAESVQPQPSSGQPLQEEPQGIPGFPYESILVGLLSAFCVLMLLTGKGL